MKRKFLTTIFALAAGSCFAVDAASSVETLKSSDIPREIKPSVLEKTASKRNSFVYLRMGVADTQAHQAPELTRGFFIPGVGLGWRLGNGASAVDISASYTQGFAGEKETRSYYYTLPKVSYLRYITPMSEESFYVGGGLALGEMKNQDASKFIGIVPSISLGYEMNRKANWHSFTELVVSQPALAFVRENDFPGPLAEFSIGFGY